MVRYSLSPKEVSSIHIMLGALPFPPLPVLLEMDSSALRRCAARAEELDAFVVATSSLAADSARGDGTVNTHSIIAALGLYHKWSGRCADKRIDTRAKMAKEGSTLDLVEAVLSCCSGSGAGLFACSDARAAEMFLATSRAWIASYLPPELTVAIRLPAPLGVLREGPLHISMAHYCHAQGVLYSSKGSLLVCEFHEQLQAELAATAARAASDPDDADAQHALDPAECRHAGMELAALYSQHPYEKLLVLCAQRLQRDALFGYKDVDKERVQENARALLETARRNYEDVLARVAGTPLASIGEAGAEDAACASRAPAAAAADAADAADAACGSLAAAAADAADAACGSLAAAAADAADAACGSLAAAAADAADAACGSLAAAAADAADAACGSLAAADDPPACGSLAAADDPPACGSLADAAAEAPPDAACDSLAAAADPVPVPAAVYASAAAPAAPVATEPSACLAPSSPPKAHKKKKRGGNKNKGAGPAFAPDAALPAALAPSEPTPDGLKKKRRSGRKKTGALEGCLDALSLGAPGPPAPAALALAPCMSDPRRLEGSLDTLSLGAPGPPSPAALALAPCMSDPRGLGAPPTSFYSSAGLLVTELSNMFAEPSDERPLSLPACRGLCQSVEVRVNMRARAGKRLRARADLQEPSVRACVRVGMAGARARVKMRG